MCPCVISSQIASPFPELIRLINSIPTSSGSLAVCTVAIFFLLGQAFSIACQSGDSPRLLDLPTTGCETELFANEHAHHATTNHHRRCDRSQRRRLSAKNARPSRAGSSRRPHSSRRHRNRPTPLRRRTQPLFRRPQAIAEPAFRPCHHENRGVAQQRRRRPHRFRKLRSRLHARSTLLYGNACV